DLLKPGGYGRFGQYLTHIEAAMHRENAKNLDDFSKDKLKNLEKAASDALTNPRYKKAYRETGMPKVKSGLGLFDCVVAPCVEACPVKQDVPEYAHLIAEGKYDQALGVILARNPLPGVTGYVCTHICQEKCTRTATNYDESIGIRLLKRIAFEKGKVTLKTKPKNNHRVAVIGAGPAGLSAAYFLALNGIGVTIFEAKDIVGGMMHLIVYHKKLFKKMWHALAIWEWKLKPVTIFVRRRKVYLTRALRLCSLAAVFKKTPLWISKASNQKAYMRRWICWKKSGVEYL
ncbi:MAG: FAD-dependent oxidoreductase, partial [Anaerolineae bacterium]|nr:FAD-dependent oxidoreductase [Anaerolineae bacterium]